MACLCPGALPCGAGKRFDLKGWSAWKMRLGRSPGPAHSCLGLRGKLYTSHHFLHHLHSHLHQSACIMNQSEIFHVFKFSQIIIFYKLFVPVTFPAR